MTTNLMKKVDLLLGNPSKAEEKLNWKREVSFNELVEEMVNADVKMASTMVADQS